MTSQGFQTVSLGQLAEFRNGVNFTKKSFGVGIKVINVRNFQDYVTPRLTELDEINPKGVVRELMAGGACLQGFLGGITSSVPVAAGLSSSAAVEVASALALRGLFELDLDSLELAKLCQRAENEFVGVKCGILDQFSSLFGQPDCGLFLDCRTLDYSVIPLKGIPVALVICDTLEKHTLIGS